MRVHVLTDSYHCGHSSRIWSISSNLKHRVSVWLAAHDSAPNTARQQFGCHFGEEHRQWALRQDRDSSFHVIHLCQTGRRPWRSTETRKTATASLRSVGRDGGAPISVTYENAPRQLGACRRLRRMRESGECTSLVAAKPCGVKLERPARRGGAMTAWLGTKRKTDA